MKLEESDKITLNELQEAVDEMEVDEQSKANLVEILTEQTNLKHLLPSGSSRTQHLAEDICDQEMTASKQPETSKSGPNGSKMLG